MALRDRLCHTLNPLHVYCRLRDIGLSRRAASRIARMYERYVFSACNISTKRRCR